MTDNSEQKIAFSDVIDALLETSSVFPPRFLYRLSGLEGSELESFQDTWIKIAPERRERLLEDLETLAESNFLVNFDEVFITGMGDSLPRVREIAARALWDNEDPTVAKIFLDLLENDPDTHVRAQAASSLGKFIFLGEMEEIDDGFYRMIFEKLSSVYHSRQPESIRCKALESMGFSSFKEVQSMIEQAFINGKEDWLISALVAMGHSANPQWLPNIIDNLDHQEALIRQEAAQACGEIMDDQSVSHLVQLLQDPEEDVRIAAIWALSQIGGADAEEALLALLDEAETDEEIEILENALENLEFSTMASDLNIFDLSEEDLEDMLNENDEEDDLGD